MSHSLYRYSLIRSHIVPMRTLALRHSGHQGSAAEPASAPVAVPLDLDIHLSFVSEARIGSRLPRDYDR
jgi:hypothetical protein